MGARAGLLVGLALLSGWLTGCGSDDDSLQPIEQPYELSRSIELARLSLYAYQALEDFNAGRPFVLPNGYDLVSEILTSERYTGEPLGSPGRERIPIAYVAIRGGTLYVVFRGTVTISEWLKNIKLAQRAYEFIPMGGNTEVGFTEVYGSIHEDIIEAVEDVIGGGGITQVFVTGHSLGGALAALAAPELADRLMVKPAVYTFAAPRAGNRTFSQRYNALINPSWRVVNRHDLVPTLPPRTVIALDLKTYHYVHVAAEQRISFGRPVTITDLRRVEENHSLCGYYDALCEQLGDAMQITECRHMADGAHGCNPQ
jgi:triacylglycerol lipase